MINFRVCRCCYLMSIVTLQVIIVCARVVTYVGMLRCLVTLYVRNCSVRALHTYHLRYTTMQSFTCKIRHFIDAAVVDTQKGSI